MVSNAEESGVRPVLRTRTSEYHVRDDGIVVQTVVTSGKMTLEDAQANTRLFNQLTDGVERPLLVDMSVPYSTEPGVREHYASEEAARWVTAVAMHTPSAAARIVGNFFLRLQSPGYPCKMFGTVEEAVAWLHTQPKS